jgi:hemoglobin
VTVLAADNAHTQDKQTVPGKSLYERLVASAIAAVVDHWRRGREESHRRPSPELAARMAPNLEAGLKFMRTLWVCNVPGGPFSSRPPSRQTPLGLRRPIETCASPLRGDEVANSDEAWTS